MSTHIGATAERTTSGLMVVELTRLKNVRGEKLRRKSVVAKSQKETRSSLLPRAGVDMRQLHGKVPLRLTMELVANTAWNRNKEIRHELELSSLSTPLKILRNIPSSSAGVIG